MQKPRRHSVQLQEILQVNGFVGFCKRGLYMEMIAAHVGGPGQGFPCSLLPGSLSSRGPPPSLVFRTEDVWLRCNQFIETIDNSRPVAISLSSNHSLRAPSVYASTEVGTWLLSVLTFLRSNAFVRVVLDPVFSLICLKELR
jgi:hypothetical protein